MKIRVILFAQMELIAGTKEIMLPDIRDTDELQLRMKTIHPDFEKHKYLIAVEKEIVHTNTTLSDGNTVALLPPYSGG